MSFTPTPWGPYGSPGQGFTSINGFVTIGSVHNTEPLGQMWGCDYHDSEANAEFVCRAVNCHQELVDALEDALSSFACYCGHPACRNCHRTKNAEAAIAKATKGA